MWCVLLAAVTLSTITLSVSATAPPQEPASGDGQDKKPGPVGTASPSASRAVAVIDTLVPEGFRDGDDESSALLHGQLAVGQDLALYRLRRLVAMFDRDDLARVLRRAPIYRIRIHAIRTANDNGTQASAITQQDIGTAIASASRAGSTGAARPR